MATFLMATPQGVQPLRDRFRSRCDNQSPASWGALLKESNSKKQKLVAFALRASHIFEECICGCSTHGCQQLLSCTVLPRATGKERVLYSSTHWSNGCRDVER
eukprot:704749-Amphidinium_carterae.1